MFVLRLNPMTANAERCTVLGRAETKEALVRWLESEMVEPYRDGQWNKCFRKGGPLEWYNPPDGDFFFPTFEDIGTLTDWIRRAENDWNRVLREIPEVH